KATLVRKRSVSSPMCRGPPGLRRRVAMGELQLSPFGLLLAAIMSVTNVMTDVWRKRALEKRELFSATLWMRVAVAALFCIVLIVVGSPAMHRTAFGEGWTAANKGVNSEKGRRYNPVVAVLVSIPNPVDKKLVDLSDVYVETVSYGLGLVNSFFLLARSQGAD